MNTSIGDEVALVFASQFYSSIGFGKNLKIAFNQAEAALMLEGMKKKRHRSCLFEKECRQRILF